MPPFSPSTVQQALVHLKRRDRILREVIERIGPFRMKRRTNRYEALLRSIVSQQISTLAARSIWARIEAAAGETRLNPQVINRLPDDVLRQAGISPQKLRYVRDLGRCVESGELRLHSLHRLADEEVIAELTQVKGIGVWTAQMFLMFSLGRLDVLPHGDLGIQSAIRRLYDLDALPSREQSETIASPWRPYATVACWYLWRSIEAVPVDSRKR